MGCRGLLNLLGVVVQRALAGTTRQTIHADIGPSSASHVRLPRTPLTHQERTAGQRTSVEATPGLVSLRNRSASARTTYTNPVIRVECPRGSYPAYGATSLKPLARHF